MHVYDCMCGGTVPTYIAFVEFLQLKFSCDMCGHQRFLLLNHDQMVCGHQQVSFLLLDHMYARCDMSNRYV